MQGINVLQPGMSSTVQDLGRLKAQSNGFPESGAMDRFAHRLANLLVNNDLTAATLEYCLLGPTVKFDVHTFIALTGGEVSAKVNHTPIAMNTVIEVKPGDILTIGSLKRGRFGYLGIAGNGIQVPKVLDSRATTLKIQVGGYLGRALQAGDHLPITAEFIMPSLNFRKTTVTADDTAPIHFIKGPHWSLFPPAAQQAFLHQTYHISTGADRMGYRLSGQPIAIPKANLLSEGTVMGEVQITRDGLPIVLMADRQTTGGYPVIATITAVDLARLVQFDAKKAIQFAATNLETAVAALKQKLNQAAILHKHWLAQRYQAPIGPNRQAAGKIETLLNK